MYHCVCVCIGERAPPPFTLCWPRSAISLLFSTSPNSPLAHYYPYGTRGSTRRLPFGASVDIDFAYFAALVAGGNLARRQSTTTSRNEEDVGGSIAKELWPTSAKWMRTSANATMSRSGSAKAYVTFKMIYECVVFDWFPVVLTDCSIYELPSVARYCYVYSEGRTCFLGYFTWLHYILPMSQYCSICFLAWIPLRKLYMYTL